jgi:hypothetical protein
MTKSCDAGFSQTFDFLRCWMSVQLEKGSPNFKEHKHMLHSSLINFFMSTPTNYGFFNFLELLHNNNFFILRCAPQNLNRE